MCGIAGCYGYIYEEGIKNVQIMIDSMISRGPDDSGIFFDNKVCFGHRRLSIIDLSPLGHQPMESFDKLYTIVYNGEVYNYKEIRKELESIGYHFRGNSDTEVILTAYQEWKEKSLQKLRGMFAFAIWDKKNKSIFLARDRLGIKPLYYFYSKNKFIFSSSVKAILKTGKVPLEIEPIGVLGYFSFASLPSPYTLIKNLFSLYPAHYMIVSEKGIQIEKYWDIDFNIKNNDIDEIEIYREVYNILGEAVKLRMISDVPIGAFLSGGIDSTAVVALMTQYSKIPVKTYSIIFDEAEFDESVYSDIVAKKFKTEHTKIKVTSKDVVSQFHKFIDSMDQPSLDGINTYFISEVVKKQGITVALSGLGGDEVFGGYSSFKRLPWIHLLINILKYIPKKIHIKTLNYIESFFKSGIKEQKLFTLLKELPSVEDSYFLSRTVFLDNVKEKLFTKKFRKNYPNLAYNSSYQNIIKDYVKDFDLVDKLSYLEYKTYMHDTLLKDTDVMSMAHSLEVRVPLIDHKLIEFIATVPSTIRVGTDIPKRLIVKSLGNLLPKEVVYRPKMGFTFPFEKWLKGPLVPFIDLLLSEFSSKEIIDYNFVKEYWEKFKRGSKEVTYSRIWTILAFELWHRRVFC